MGALLLMTVVTAQVFSYPAMDPGKLVLYRGGVPMYFEVVPGKAVVHFAGKAESEVKGHLGASATLSVIPDYSPVPQANAYAVVEFPGVTSPGAVMDTICETKAAGAVTGAWPVCRVKGSPEARDEVFFPDLFYVSFNAGVTIEAARETITGTGAIVAEIIQGPNGRVRGKGTVPDGTPVDQFLAIINTIRTQPGIRFVAPDVVAAASQSGHMSMGIGHPTGKELSCPTALNPSSGTVQIEAQASSRQPARTLTAQTAGPQWARVVPVYYGALPCQAEGEGMAVADNPSKSCNAVMVSSQGISVQLTDITYELERGILVGADLGANWGDPPGDLYNMLAWCDDSVTAGVYMICTDELGWRMPTGFDLTGFFDELYTSCKAINPDVAVGMYDANWFWPSGTPPFPIDSYVKNASDAVYAYSLACDPPHPHYPDFIGLNWDVHSGGNSFNDVIAYAQDKGIKSFMYFWGPPTGSAEAFYQTYYKADAVFIFGLDHGHPNEQECACDPELDKCPWEHKYPWTEQIKPFIDEYLGPPCLKVRSGGTDVGMVDKKGNLVLNGTVHGNWQDMGSVSPPEFLVRDYEGRNVMRITNTGDLFLKGYISHHYDVGGITESGVFRVENSRAVCAQDGNLFISGIYYEHGKP